MIHVPSRNENIEVNFMHYSSFQEATEKWHRRMERVDLEHAVVFFMHTPFLTEECMEKFAAIPYGTKIFAYDSDEIGQKELKNVKCYHTSAFHWNPEFSWNFPVMLKDTNMKKLVNCLK